MTDDLPPQQPEGALLQERLQKDGRSVRQIASQAGISDARWRQIVKGWMKQSGGAVVPVIAPAATLARMAVAVGISYRELIDVGREDAAEALRVEATAPPMRTNHGGSVSSLSSHRAEPDEIDLIYQSSLPAREKLLLIRKVLMLRAQAEADEAAATLTGPATTADQAAKSGRQG